MSNWYDFRVYDHPNPISEMNINAVAFYAHLNICICIGRQWWLPCICLCGSFTDALIDEVCVWTNYDADTRNCTESTASDASVGQY